MTARLLDDEMQSGTDIKQIFAEFITRRDTSNRVSNIFAQLYLFNLINTKPWQLKLNLKSFEVMHGMSRVAMLVPDKLATAIAINKEDLPDPDDGGFLIQLLIDLVAFYISSYCNSTWSSADSENNDSRIEELTGNDTQLFVSPEVTVELSNILLKFKKKLEVFKTILGARRGEEVNISEALVIVQMSDSIFELSTAYMDFVHPIYLDIQRHGDFNEDKIELLKKKLIEKMSEIKNKLKDEFVSLTSPKSTEE